MYSTHNYNNKQLLLLLLLLHMYMMEVRSAIGTSWSDEVCSAKNAVCLCNTRLLCAAGEQSAWCDICGTTWHKHRACVESGCSPSPCSLITPTPAQHQWEESRKSPRPSWVLLDWVQQIKNLQHLLVSVEMSPEKKTKITCCLWLHCHLVVVGGASPCHDKGTDTASQQLKSLFKMTKCYEEYPLYTLCLLSEIHNLCISVTMEKMTAVFNLEY